MENKKKIMDEFKISPNDTGSVEVQIALLTNRINELTEHTKTHSKDFSTKRGLLKLVGQRRRFLKYIQNHNPKKYEELLERLDLRK